jgi:rhodanese-related sulfurtransferase
MSKIDEILAVARGRSKDWPYAGAVTPQEAYELISADNAVKLVDVRTNAERDWVGRVAIPEAQHGAVQWSIYPGGIANHEFIEQLNSVARKDQVLLFLCRSGVRSRGAAKLATEHGYQHCYDILEGFEGDKDDNQHRNSVGGWRVAGLPWTQGYETGAEFCCEGKCGEADGVVSGTGQGVSAQSAATRSECRASAIHTMPPAHSAIITAAASAAAGDQASIITPPAA